MALTPKQQTFAEQYLRCFNATEAARRAGFNHGRSMQSGYELKNHPEVKHYIEERLAAQCMTTNEVLANLREIGAGEHGTYITEEGEFDVRQCVKDDKARLIKAIRPTKYGKGYEFCDRIAALQLIGRNQRMFTDGLDINLPEVDERIDRLMEDVALRRKTEAHPET